MKYNYSTEVAAGACPGCGQAVILYHHVRLTPGEKRTRLTVLDSIFCRECVVKMAEPKPQATIGTNHRDTEARRY